MPTQAQQAEFAGIVESIFAAFPGARHQATFTTPGSGGVYDPITGETVGGTPGASQTLEVIIDDYNAKEVDGQAIQRNDFKLICRAKDFAQIEPRSDNLTVSARGVSCRVMTAETDPMGAHWVLQVRQL